MTVRHSCGYYRDVNKDRRLGLGLGLVGASLSFFTVTSIILIYTNKLAVSYGGP